MQNLGINSNKYQKEYKMKNSAIVLTMIISSITAYAVVAKVKKERVKEAELKELEERIYSDLANRFLNSCIRGNDPFEEYVASEILSKL